ncbi:MAG: hypothetical protein QOK21_4222 [Solirubrobacteraceae bacterium]|nr:hypothetical protein [Solirubrobacteraceae bacterium]
MRLRLSLAAVAAVLVSAAPAAAAGDPIMPLSQVHSGMRCTGYSVVRGTTISSFDVEVLDVVDGDPNENGPRILVQVSGPAVDGTGIGPGFSGSPIYCPGDDGVQRNIGAISESIGEYGGRTVLATPIEAILTNKPDAPHAGASAASAGPRRTQRVRRAERRLRRVGARSLTGPLTVSGLSAPLGRALEAAGRRAGRPVLAAPAGPLGSFPRQPLRPGSAVAVGYSSGDLRLGAIGTVAYTDDAAVWAFGHPFEAAGRRSLYLQDAYVFHVVNDPNAGDATGGSYKLSAPGHDVGTLTNDALDAVVGRVGALPRSIPIRVRSHDDDTGRAGTVHVNAASETEVGDPTGFSPAGQVAPLAVLQGATQVLAAAPGRLSGRMCLRITLRERRTPARFCNRYASTMSTGDAGGNGVALDAGLDVLDAFGLIDAYEGRPPHVTAVRATVHARRGERLAALRSVRAPKVVRAGRRMRLRVRLQRVRGDAFTRTIRVRVPHGSAGRTMLTLRGADQPLGSADGFVELLIGDTQPRAPATLDKLVAAIDGIGRYDGVTARLGHRSVRAFRDRDLLVTGRARTHVRVRP